MHFNIETTNMLKKVFLYSGLMAFIALFNFVQFIDGENNLFRLFVSGVFLLYMPGFFLSKIIKLSVLEAWEKILIRIGLSVGFLMFYPLLLNWTLPLSGVTQPLTNINLLAGFNLASIFLLVVSFIRDDEIVGMPKLQINRLSFLLIIISSCMPLLSIFGATLQNNGGSNIISMILLWFVGIYILLLSLTRTKVNHSVFPWSIIMISLATVFLLSMRSWFISGFDISQEYRLFQLTKYLGVWEFKNYVDAYNSCLSITILPTVLSAFTNISDQYVYKFIYTTLFSFSTVALYLFSKRLTNVFIAFLASLFYIAQVWFVDPMVTLARQEIAFLFFMLLLLTLFNAQLSFVKKHILLLIFGFSLIVSHYSTTYVTLAMLTIVYILSRFQPNQWSFKRNKFVVKNLYGENRPKFYLNGFYLLTLIAFAFVWYTQITTTSHNIIDFSKNTYNSLSSFATLQSRSTIIDQIFKGPSITTSADTYKLHYQQILKDYDKRTDLARYAQSTYQDYKLLPKTPPTLPIKNDQIYIATKLIYQFIIIAVQLFLLVGIANLLFKKIYFSKQIPIEYKNFVLTSILFLGAIVAIPYVSQGYNFDRMYMHTMFLLAPVIITGGIYGFEKVTRNKTVLPYFLVTIILVGLYWFSYGLVWQLTGGKAVVWLNNTGFYYDIAYTHKTEVASAEWLAERYDTRRVYTSSTGRNILWAYGQIDNTNSDVFPASLDKSSYVYATYPNVIDKINYFFYRGSHLGYEYPYEYINNQKNKVYSNGESEVYQ
jgi:uncharacterized membrane protein